jgi:hypothetical protein
MAPQPSMWQIAWTIGSSRRRWPVAFMRAFPDSVIDGNTISDSFINGWRGARRSTWARGSARAGAAARRARSRARGRRGCNCRRARASPRGRARARDHGAPRPSRYPRPHRAGAAARACARGRGRRISPLSGDHRGDIRQDPRHADHVPARALFAEPSGSDHRALGSRSRNLGADTPAWGLDSPTTRSCYK